MGIIHGKISVCTDCMLLHANGEYDPDRPESEPEPLSAIPEGFRVTLGITEEEHSEYCTPADREEGCGCEQLGFSYWACEGCGSTLGGDRFAMTLWDERIPSV